MTSFDRVGSGQKIFSISQKISIFLSERLNLSMNLIVTSQGAVVSLFCGVGYFRKGVA